MFLCQTIRKSSYIIINIPGYIFFFKSPLLSFGRMVLKDWGEVRGGNIYLGQLNPHPPFRWDLSIYSIVCNILLPGSKIYGSRDSGQSSKISTEGFIKMVMLGVNKILPHPLCSINL